MADPLHSKDYRDFNTRASSGGTGLDENRGKRMAYQAPIQDPIRKSALRLDRELPSETVGVERQLEESGNARLNRTAEQIGAALGRVISTARRVPDSARERIHLVRDRAGEVRSAATGRVEQRARKLADTAQDTARQLMDVAEERGRVLLDKVDELGHAVAERAGQIKNQLDDRTRELRSNVQLRAEEARLRGEGIIREYPLQALACVAGAAFILGVSLRIVRARNAHD